MALRDTLAKLEGTMRKAAKAAEPVALLLARLTIGGLFVSTGWGKIHNLAKVTSYFVSLGIPMPGFNATLVGWSEFICGALLLAGLVSRFATVPLIVSMVIALLTAKRSEIDGVLTLLGEIEFTYLAFLVVIAVFGPGAISLDAGVAHFLKKSVAAGEGKVVPGGPVSRGA